MVPEFPARVLALTLPLAVYEGLAALASEEEPVEDVAARLLAEVVRYGTPGALRAAAQLATQIADTLFAERQQLRSEVAALRRRLGDEA